MQKRFFENVRGLGEICGRNHVKRVEPTSQLNQRFMY
jgi:hypothetical protein